MVKTTYRAGFKLTKGQIKYVGKPRMSGAAARAAIKRVCNLRQYKGKASFIAQNLIFAV